MLKQLIFGFLILLLCFPRLTTADAFETNASYIVCFTPGMDCTNDIVQSIDSAVKNIWVQAYSFTSHPIGKALVNAKQRGVDVKIIFDKSALSGRAGTIRYFKRNGIPVWIDSQMAIAHNKVMIIDQTKVITGSFNFTRAAQQQNAENLLIINDAGLAQKYLKNWQSRVKISNGYTPEPVALQTINEDPWQPWQNLWTRFINWLLSWFRVMVSAPHH